MLKGRNYALAAAVIAASANGPAAAQEILVGILGDMTGPTTQLGLDFGPAKVDAIEWINANGGINGKKIKIDMVDFAYKVPAAVSTYKRWTAAAIKPALIFGYGTADTEALSRFTNDDKIVFYSHSFSAKLTDPKGKSGNVAFGTPFNFFHGPTYPDGCRAVVTWALKEWKSKGQKGKPKLVYMGDNHPFPNSPKETCLAAAGEMGFDVLPSIQYSMRPGDFKAQCLTLRESGAHYAFLANAGESNITLLKSCATVGVNVRYLSQIWGYNEIVMDAVGEAANGVVIPLHVKPWDSDVPGMKLVRTISKGKPRSTFYVAAICTAFYGKEALEWADKNGGITGENVRKGMVQKKNWEPKGLEGVCAPATWTDEDGRSVVKVDVVEGRISNGKAGFRLLETADVGRDPKWLGK